MSRNGGYFTLLETINSILSTFWFPDQLFLQLIIALLHFIALNSETYISPSSPIPLEILVYVQLSSIYESSYLPFVLPILDCPLNRQSALNKCPVNNQLISSLGLKLHLCIRAHNKHVP